MVNFCCVSTCPTKRDKTIPKTLHAFPADENLCNHWKAKVGLVKTDRVEHKRVCSLHFNPADFRTDLKRVKLKEGAVPRNIDLGTSNFSSA